uniref:VWA domain-containing protein n=1 Tax=Thermorudis peleae TaxID=1382356 RepID=A0A831TAW0_9BACT
MTFQWPYLLASLVLVPLLLLVYVLAQRRRQAYALRFTNLALLAAVAGPRPGLRRHVPPLLFLLGLTALLLSLARPTAVIALPQDQAHVVIVLDVSGSMRADDLRPNRLAAAIQATEALLESLPGQAQVGVVTFNSDGSVLVPLTRDRGAVREALAGLRADGGTAIGDGLDRALDLLEPRAEERGNEPPPPSVIILLSDGESREGMPPALAAERARELGVTVQTVGIGERGRRILLDGRTQVGLDEATLRQIAEMTGGRYFYAAETTELEEIYAGLGSQVRWVEERTEITALVTGAGALFLIAGGLLSLRWFQRLP